MTRKADRAWLKRLLLPVLLPLWAAFAASWVIVSTHYSLHLDLFPVPTAGSLSTDLVALILYMPPIVLLLTTLDVPPRGGTIDRALLVLGWALAALLVAAFALAAPAVIEIARR